MPQAEHASRNSHIAAKALKTACFWVRQKPLWACLPLSSAPSPCLMPAEEAPTCSAAAQLVMHRVQRKLSAAVSAHELFCRGCHAGVAFALLQTVEGIA